MKKCFSKIAGVMLAVLLILSASVPAFAWETQTGTITIKDVTAGETYSFYKLLDVTSSTFAGGEMNYSYRVNEKFDAFFGTLSIPGYNSADDKITTKECKAAYDYISPKVSPEQIADFATDVAIWARANHVNPVITKSATTAEDIVINSVEQGYYVMVPSSTLISDQKTLTSALFSINTLADRVDIHNKSVYPTLTKKIVEGESRLDKADASYNNVIKYELTSNVPASMNGYKEYKFVVTDVLDANLTFNNDVAIKVGNRVLASGSDFTVAHSSSNQITITFNNFLQYNTDTYRNKDIFITYSATVKTDADLGSTGNKNGAYLTFSNDPADTSSTDRTTETSVKIYSSGIKFTKVAAKDGSTPLANAAFRITGWAKGETPVINGKAVSADATFYDIVTDDTGTIAISGLKAGIYTITETDAPNGYLKLDDPIVITISFDEATGNFSVAEVDDDLVSGLVLQNAGGNDGVAVLKIMNETMSILPATGSTVFIVCVCIGAGLIITGIVLFAKSRKSQRSSD